MHTNYMYEHKCNDNELLSVWTATDECVTYETYILVICCVFCAMTKNNTLVDAHHIKETALVHTQREKLYSQNIY